MVFFSREGLYLSLSVLGTSSPGSVNPVRDLGVVKLDFIPCQLGQFVICPSGSQPKVWETCQGVSLVDPSSNFYLPSPVSVSLCSTELLDFLPSSSVIERKPKVWGLGERPGSLWDSLFLPDLSSVIVKF